MLPEVRVMLERARSARVSLDGLLDVLPADYWSTPKSSARKVTGPTTRTARSLVRSSL